MNKILIDGPSFAELSNSAVFEKITNGREGAVLVDSRNGLVPIVRTTTKYSNPAQCFREVHYNIMDQIKTKTDDMQLKFNNALFEKYTNEYKTMGYHSDQALDLDNDSYIAVYSCYSSPDPIDVRVLRVKDKETNETFDIKMDHNSVILFSVSTNSKYLHKIILETSQTDETWIGLTLRLSKTFVEFKDDVPYINGNVLTCTESKQFYKLRGNENRSTVPYEYPELNYTISKSDTIRPV